MVELLAPPFFLRMKVLPFGRTTEALSRLGPPSRRRSRGGWGLWSWCVLVGGGGARLLPSFPVLVVTCWSFHNFQQLLALFADWLPVVGVRLLERSGRRGDSCLPSGSGPRRRVAESMFSFKLSGSSHPRQLMSSGGFGPAVLAGRDLRQLDRNFSWCFVRAAPGRSEFGL